MRLVRPWPRLPREAVAAPSLAVLKARLDGALGTLGWGKGSLLVAGGWNWMSSKVLPKPFWDSPIPLPVGGGLLQRGLPGAGELGDGLAAGKDPEGLEEAGSDEDLLFCCCGPRKWEDQLGGAAWLWWGDLPFAPTAAWAVRVRCGAVLTMTWPMERALAALRAFLARFEDHPRVNEL